MPLNDRAFFIQSCFVARIHAPIEEARRRRAGQPGLPGLVWRGRASTPLIKCKSARGNIRDFLVAAGVRIPPSPPYLIDYEGFFSLFDFQPTKPHTIESVSRAFPSALESDCLDRAKLRWAGNQWAHFQFYTQRIGFVPTHRSSHSLSENAPSGMKPRSPVRGFVTSALSDLRGRRYIARLDPERVRECIAYQVLRGVLT